MRLPSLRRGLVLAGLLPMLLVSPASGASPEPSSWRPAHDQALAAVRAVDPRFADLPDLEDVWREAVAEFDLSPVLAGSWMQVLPTFEILTEPALVPSPVWSGLGLGQLVEVMLVDGCVEKVEDSPTHSWRPAGDEDPCEWRHAWIFRVLTTGEVLLVSEGGSPDTGG